MKKIRVLFLFYRNNLKSIYSHYTIIYSDFNKRYIKSVDIMY